jgi:hypothetical protein
MQKFPEYILRIIHVLESCNVRWRIAEELEQVGKRMSSQKVDNEEPRSLH